MGRLPLEHVDPVVRMSTRIELHHKVATAGSCFAQHIARTLQDNGLLHFVAGRGEGMPAEELERRQFGIYSARYGNLYTTRQLLQLIARAYGDFSPSEGVWERSDGRWIDPFRPQVEPDGFENVAELEASRASHLAAVRSMFETLDVFVFTMGQTETWRSRIDGAVFPLAPGVDGGKLDLSRHEFVNFGVSESVRDMRAFIARLLRVNPKARIVITVSPVAMMATYEHRHVLVSNAHTKAVLRSAAHEVCAAEVVCEYFPAYEIVTGAHTGGRFIDSDLRTVKPEGVKRVMDLFMQHCVAAAPLATTPASAARSSFHEELNQNNFSVRNIVCEEDSLDISDSNF